MLDSNIQLPVEASCGNSNIIDAFKGGMGRLAAGVSLITTASRGVDHGFIATAVTSVCAEPPTLLVCANTSTSAHDPIYESEILCVNVLSTSHKEIAGHFSSSKSRDLRFKRGTWSVGSTGAPVLGDALAAFNCKVVKKIPHGTHTIFIAEVCSVNIAVTEVDPLLYVDKSYRNLVALSSV
ncbi:flavin reductase family protein [Pseudomonas chlororaphis]|uniref:flavin reductase family protein n=1 Tax=Pseudomonas chlororaphis TaxID=587753 RepID=UPI002407DC87|nr:flavin reductase family protein [Pseudomonas chlororaphis]